MRLSAGQTESEEDTITTQTTIKKKKKKRDKKGNSVRQTDVSRN